MKISPALTVLITLLLAAPSLSFAQNSNEVKAELISQIDVLKASSESKVQQAALMAFGHVADRAQQRQLAEYKKDENANVRLGAGIGLLFAGDRTAQAFVVSELLGSTYLAGALRDTVSRLPVATQVRILKELLQKGDAQVKTTVLRYAAHQHADIYALFGDALVDRDAATRQITLDTIKESPRKQSLSFVSAMLRHRDASVRLAAIELTAQVVTFHGPLPEATELLRTALKDRSGDVWKAAARQLVEMNDSAGAQKLVGTLAGLNTPERMELVRFLLSHNARVNGDNVRKLVDSAESLDEKMLYYELAATSQETAIVEELITMFASENFDERLISARALGRTGDPKARELLERGAFEGHTDIRNYSIKGLGQLADEKSLPVLQRAASGERVKEIKLLAIEALGQIKTAATVQALRFLVADRDVDVKKQVVAALVHIGSPETTDALEILVRERNVEVQWQAFLGLLTIDAAIAMRHANTVLRSPPESFMKDLADVANISQYTVFLTRLATHSSDRVRFAMQAYLVAFGDDVMDVYRAAINDTGVANDIKQELIWRLAMSRQESNLDYFASYANRTSEPALREAALWALATYNNADISETLQGYLTSESLPTRAVAVYGLAALR